MKAVVEAEEEVKEGNYGIDERGFRGGRGRGEGRGGGEEGGGVKGDVEEDRGVHPPKANDAFPPFQIPPLFLFSKYFTVWETFSNFFPKNMFHPQ